MLKKLGGKQALKYKFDVRISQVDQLPPALVRQCRVVWSHKAKVQVTDAVAVNSGVAKFGAVLTQIATLYRDSKNQFDAKEYSFKIQAPGKNNEFLTLGKASVDMSRYAGYDAAPQNVMIPVQIKVGAISTTAYVKAVVVAVMLKELAGEDQMTTMSGMSYTSTMLPAPHASHGDEQDLEGFEVQDGEARSGSAATTPRGSERKLYQGPPVPSPIYTASGPMLPAAKAAAAVKHKAPATPNNDDDDVSPMATDSEDEPDYEPVSSRKPPLAQPIPTTKSNVLEPNSAASVSGCQPSSGAGGTKATETLSSSSLKPAQPPLGPTTAAKSSASAPLPMPNKTNQSLASPGRSGSPAPARSDAHEANPRVAPNSQTGGAQLQSENELLKAQVRAYMDQLKEAEREQNKKQEAWAQERLNLQRQILKLQDQVEEERATAEQERQDLDAHHAAALTEITERETKKREDNDRRLAEAFKMVDESLAVATKAEVEKSALKDEVAKLQEELDTAKHEVLLAEQARNQIESRACELREQIQNISESLSPHALVRAQDEEIQRLEEALAEAEEKIIQMSEENSKRMNEKVQALELRNQELEAANSELEVSSIKERAELQKQIAIVEDEKSAMQQRQTELQNQLQELRDQTLKTSQLLQDAYSQLKEMEKELDARNAEMAELQSRRGTLESLVNEKETCLARIAATNSEMLLLEENMGVSNRPPTTTDSEISELRSQVRRLEQQIVELRGSKEELERAKASLELKFQEEMDEREELQEQLRASMQDADEAAQEAVARYEDKYNKTKTKLREMEQESQAMIAELNVQLERAKEECKDLQKQLGYMNTIKSRSEKTQGKLDEAMQHANRVAGELDILRKENQDMMAELVQRKLELAQSCERDIIMRRELYKSKEQQLKLAAKATKLETKVYELQAGSKK